MNYDIIVESEQSLYFKIKVWLKTMQFYQRLKDIREDNDKTQVQIANILQTTQSYYGQYERGNRKLPIEHLRTLCIYYNVTADYLLGLIDEPRPLR